MRKIIMTLLTATLVLCGYALSIYLTTHRPTTNALEKDCNALQAEHTELKQTIPEYCYFKGEPDGDYELIYQHSGNSWGYVQVLGGDVVEVIDFGTNSEEFVIKFFGSHFSEFEKTEAINN